MNNELETLKSELDQLRAELEAEKKRFADACRQELTDLRDEVERLKAALGGIQIDGEWLNIVRLVEREERLSQADETIATLRSQITQRDEAPDEIARAITNRIEQLKATADQQKTAASKIVAPSGKQP